MLKWSTLQIHYDNGGTDANEAVEAIFPTALAGTLTLVLYNGGSTATQAAAAVVSDTFTLPNGTAIGTTGFSVASVPTPGLQNGSPDGIAIVCGGTTVAQFLSYEGVLTASTGPAAGMTSMDIGVSEAGATLPLCTVPSLCRQYAAVAMSSLCHDSQQQ